MPTLQKPPTVREIIMRSILSVRNALDTLIDREEAKAPAGVESSDRVTEVDPLPPARSALDSIAFELCRPGSGSR